MGLIMECVTINPSVPQIVWLSSNLNVPVARLQPQWQAAMGGARRVAVTKQEVSGKAWEPHPGSRIQQQSAELQAAHWCGRSLVSVVLHCLDFSKTNSYWKRTVRNVMFGTSLFYRIISKKQSFSVFLSHDGKTFFFFFGIVVYEVRERESVKKSALKTELFEKALTMQALCCDLVCPHRAEQRNGKDYPQECLGCPQTERAAWLANGSEACRAAG